MLSGNELTPEQEELKTALKMPTDQNRGCMAAFLLLNIVNQALNAFSLSKGTLVYDSVTSRNFSQVSVTG